jgi:hypothetical protein
VTISRAYLLDPDEELPVYEPDWAALKIATNEDAFVDAAVELLKSTVRAAALCAAVQDPTPLDRDAAIRCGLLVRATKLGTALIRDACRDHGELQIPLSRMLLDTVVNLHYLCGDEDGSRYQAYVFDSLISEREFLATIRARIASDPTSEVMAVEARMRRSIDEAVAMAGVRVEDIPGRGRNGWPSAKERVEAVYGPSGYLAYRAGSDALHGGWYDLFRNHISAVEGGFEPDFMGVRVRPHALLGAAVHISAASLAYLTKRPELDRKYFGPPLELLLASAMNADAAHESFLQGPG